MLRDQGIFHLLLWGNPVKEGVMGKKKMGFLNVQQKQNPASVENVNETFSNL